MRKNRFTILGVLISTLLYITGVFIEVSFDIREWSNTVRDFIGFTMFLIIIFFTIVQAIKETHEE